MQQGYKQTEIGVIPEDWELQQLKDIALFKNGVAHEKVISRNGKYTVVNSKFISSNGKVKKHSDLCLQPCYKNDILMVMSDVPNGKAIAKCFYVDKNETYTLNQRICDLNVLQDYPKYIFYAINRNPYYLAFDDGVKQTNLTKDNVLDCKILIPKNKHEQAHIADALSDTDSLITLLEKIIAKKKAAKQGVVQKLLTGKNRLPGFNECWTKIKLNDIFEFHKGSGLSKEKISADGEYPCILYGELFTRYLEVISSITNKTNYNEGLMSCKFDVLMPGSTTTNGLDLATASVVLEDDVLLGGDVVVLRPKKVMDTRIFGYLLRIMTKEILQHTQGLTIVHLNVRTLREMEVLIPSTVEEQTAIASVLADMDNEIEALEKKLAKARQIKQGMMQQLLTGKIRLE